MPDSLSLTSALLVGLMGSSHCLGMCGGISSALGMAGGRRAALFALAYNLGRILCYAALGAVVGGGVAALGGVLSQWLPTLGPWLRTLAGLLLIAMGLYVSGWWMGLTRVERLGSLLWRPLQPLAQRLLPPRNVAGALLLGAVWGLLPCGLVYSSLAWAASSGDALHSAALMAAFGAGTLPAMLLTTLGGEQLQRRLQRPAVRRVAGILLIAFGIISAALPWLPGHAGHGAAHQHQHPAAASH